MHELRKSFMDKEAAEDSEAAVLQAAIMEENKNYREEIKKLEEEKSSVQKNMKSEIEKTSGLNNQIDRLTNDLNGAKEQIELLKSENKSFEFKLKNQREEIINSSRNQLQAERMESQQVTAGLRNQFKLTISLFISGIFLDLISNLKPEVGLV